MNLNKIAEAKIRAAIERGELTDLPGQGQPIDLNEYFNAPAGVRAIYDLLKKNGVRPREVDLLKEVGHLKRLKKQEKRKTIQTQIERQLNSKMTELNIRLEKRKCRY